jgi:hypothetical protein
MQLGNAKLEASHTVLKFRFLVASVPNGSFFVVVVAFSAKSHFARLTCIRKGATREGSGVCVEHCHQSSNSLSTATCTHVR